MAEAKARKEADAGTGPVSSAAGARYILVLYQGLDTRAEDDEIGASLVTRLRHQCDDLIKEPKDQVEVDVWLESPGGDAHAAYKLALVLRGKAHHLRVVVPDYAKSAATLLTLAADEIFMAPAAELGPLDAQIPREGGLVTVISALDIARSLEDLAQTALDLAIGGGAHALHITRLTRAETLSMMLDFSAKFMEPIVRQMDPALIHWSSTLLDVSVSYAERLLALRSPQAKPALARLPRLLVENYPTHGFVISRDEARDRLQLPVFDLDKYDFSDEACRRHREFELSRVSVVEVLRVSDLKTAEEPK
ncbi:MAG: SDH family Clp fold serine proteinase [Candidatus Dormibacteria bacterium]